MPHKDKAARLTYLRAYRAAHRPPPKPAEQADGHLTAMGVIEFSADGAKVRCHVCGRWYGALNGHFRTHDLTEASYKEAYGLKRTASLLPPVTAEKYRAAALARDQGAIGRDYLPAAVGRPVGRTARLQHRIEASNARAGCNLRAGDKTNDR